MGVEQHPSHSDAQPQEAGCHQGSGSSNSSQDKGPCEEPAEAAGYGHQCDYIPEEGQFLVETNSTQSATSRQCQYHDCDMDSSPERCPSVVEDLDTHPLPTRGSGPSGDPGSGCQQAGVGSSTTGWGAPGAPLPPSPAQPKGEFPWAQGFWGEGEADLHINLQEALAALRGIQALIPKPNLLPPNSTIALQVDSTTTAAYLQKNLQGGRKQTVWGVLQPLHQWLSKHNLNLEAHWVASEDNIADGPSRVSADRTDWTLHPAIREVLLDKLGLDPKVDLFATWQNTQCPYFISRGPQPSTKHRTQVACNTWNTPPSALPYRVWWANPPWGELQHLPGWVDKMPKGALVVALFPRWEQQLWYHRLIRRHNNNYPLLLIPGQGDRGRGSSSSSSSKGGSTQRLLSPFTNPSIRGSHWPQWQTCCAVLHSSLSGPVVGDRRLPNFTRLNW